MEALIGTLCSSVHHTLHYKSKCTESYSLFSLMKERNGRKRGGNVERKEKKKKREEGASLMGSVLFLSKAGTRLCYSKRFSSCFQNYNRQRDK